MKPVHSLCACGLSALLLPQAWAQELLPRAQIHAAVQQAQAAVVADQVLQNNALLPADESGGRRLTPAQRAELREQLRREWAQREQPAAVDVAPVPSAAQNEGWTWRAMLPWGQPRP